MYVGSLELKNALPSQFQRQSTLPSGRGEGVTVFETGLAFYVAH